MGGDTIAVMWTQRPPSYGKSTSFFLAYLIILSFSCTYQFSVTNYIPILSYLTFSPPHSHRVFRHASPYSFKWPSLLLWQRKHWNSSTAISIWVTSSLIHFKTALGTHAAITCPHLSCFRAKKFSLLVDPL